MNKKNLEKYVPNEGKEDEEQEGELESDISDDEESPTQENASKWNFQQLEAKLIEMGINYLAI